MAGSEKFLRKEITLASYTSGRLVKTSFTVHPDQLARMDRVARERHISKSVILREAINHELDRLERGEPVVVAGAA